MCDSLVQGCGRLIQVCGRWVIYLINNPPWVQVCDGCIQFDGWVQMCDRLGTNGTMHFASEDIFVFLRLIFNLIKKNLFLILKWIKKLLMISRIDF